MSTERDNGGQAFPRQFQRWDNDYSRWEPQQPEEGMALRDYFAAKAMPMLAATFYSTGQQLTDGTVPDLVAPIAYEFADAMLKARQA